MKKSEITRRFKKLMASDSLMLGDDIVREDEKNLLESGNYPIALIQSDSIGTYCMFQESERANQHIIR